MTKLDGINSIEKAPDTRGVKESRAAAETPRTDHAGGSSAGGLVEQRSSSSGVRTEKLAQLQAAIANGTYNVPTSAVADKLVEHLLNR